jgi:hypothetical protein
MNNDGELRCCGGISSFCSTSGTRRIALVIATVKQVRKCSNNIQIMVVINVGGEHRGYKLKCTYFPDVIKDVVGINKA